MGEIFRVECKSCDYTREANVGVGRMGVGVELCPCYHCHRFVMKKVVYRNAVHPLTLKCPYCQKVIKPIKRSNKCAACGGRLAFETLGEWD